MVSTTSIFNYMYMYTVLLLYYTKVIAMPQKLELQCLKVWKQHSLVLLALFSDSAKTNCADWSINVLIYFSVIVT